MQSTHASRAIALPSKPETDTPHSALALQFVTRQSSGDLLIRQAVLHLFSDSSPQVGAQLENLNPGQWMRLLRWLDFGGLALYFLDHLTEMGCETLLPPPIHAGLHQRLHDNTKRTHSMTAESIAIQRGFQERQIPYALLKGLSLWPTSVPKPEFRSQFDLDFLVSEESAPVARTVLESRGYRLYAISGNSWEFKCNEQTGMSLKDVYKDLQSWTVELHIEPASPPGHSQLESLEYRDLLGFTMPVLSSINLFVGHGIHTFKHIRGEFTRASQLVEFRRHVLYRQNNNEFWKSLRHAADNDKRASIALGVATLLTTQVMGDFAPASLTSWTVERLPASVHLWCRMYGQRAGLGSFPGTKLYLLLQKELEDEGIASRRSAGKALLPSRLPPAIVRPLPGESLRMRLRRYQMQFAVITHRLLFHAVEGIRYMRELRQWRRQLRRPAR